MEPELERRFVGLASFRLYCLLPPNRAPLFSEFKGRNSKESGRVYLVIKRGCHFVLTIFQMKTVWNKKQKSLSSPIFKKLKGYNSKLSRGIKLVIQLGLHFMVKTFSDRLMKIQWILFFNKRTEMTVSSNIYKLKDHNSIVLQSSSLTLILLHIV